MRNILGRLALAGLAMLVMIFIAGPGADAFAQQRPPKASKAQRPVQGPKMQRPLQGRPQGQPKGQFSQGKAKMQRPPQGKAGLQRPPQGQPPQTPPKAQRLPQGQPKGPRPQGKPKAQRPPQGKAEGKPPAEDVTGQFRKRIKGNTIPFGKAKIVLGPEAKLVRAIKFERGFLESGYILAIKVTDKSTIEFVELMEKVRGDFKPDTEETTSPVSITGTPQTERFSRPGTLRIKVTNVP